MINPVLYEVRNATKSLDSVLHVVSSVFDENAKNNIRGILQNFNNITSSFTITAGSLNTLLDPRNGGFAKTLENANSFSGNLAANNQKVTDIMLNANKAAANFAKVDLQITLTKLNSTVDSLQHAIAKISSKDGSLGLLLNDTKLYNNLTSTSNKINILLDDIRVHPKRFLGFSVFGKKDKGNFLTAPLIDDTLKVLPPNK
jgi:phospholipid/cholesterol/gamma-HCH transport system substrate-binding protein